MNLRPYLEHLSVEKIALETTEAHAKLLRHNHSTKFPLLLFFITVSSGMRPSINVREI